MTDTLTIKVVIVIFFLCFPYNVTKQYNGGETLKIDLKTSVMNVKQKTKNNLQRGIVPCISDASPKLAARPVIGDSISKESFFMFLHIMQPFKEND